MSRVEPVHMQGKLHLTCLQMAAHQQHPALQVSHEIAIHTAKAFASLIHHALCVPDRPFTLCASLKKSEDAACPRRI